MVAGGAALSGTRRILGRMRALSSIPFKQVVVQTDEIGPLRAVKSVREAAECLVDDWPTEGRGRAYHIACIICHRTLAGDIAAEAARRAFIAAAKEAGVFVREGRRRRR